jgi:hypothetical protein
MKKLLFAMLLLGTMAGCSPANISVAMRGSDHENPSMETRCEPCDMRSASELKQALSKYDGWRMIYVSEYTTEHKVGTDGLMCFERPKK